MVLVDTSVWVEHLRNGKIGLDVLLKNGEVVCHPFIIGELACGNLRNRKEFLSLIQSLPLAVHAEHEEVMRFIDIHRLMGLGLGYVDMHLLTSALLTHVPIWTLDNTLRNVYSRINPGSNGFNP